MIAALFVQRDGCYWDLPDVDPYDEERDARLYAGPWPVVAHPPCARWGRYWHGSPSKPHQFELGDDGGCFAAALAAVRKWGGVLEHPAGSNAWGAHQLWTPGPRGWCMADTVGGWTCLVDQGHHGHSARKATWLYAVGCDRRPLTWGPCLAPDRPLEHMSKRQRAATPIEFRDLLLDLARSVNAA